jgi:hypothetical protein
VNGGHVEQKVMKLMVVLCTLSFKTSRELVAASEAQTTFELAGIVDMANPITLHKIAPCSADGA